MSEKQKFDYKQFESLTKLELGLFCIKRETIEAVDEDFLEYFKKNCEFMDSVHLEHALGLIEKANLKVAYPFVANYIDHPVTYVRMPAIRTLTQWLNNYEIDEAVLNNPLIMSKVEKTLQDHADLQGVEELKHIVQKKREIES
jgi:hypothetical protein